MNYQLNLPKKALRCFTHKAQSSLNMLFFLLFFIPALSFAQDKKPVGEVIASIGSVKAAGTDQKERSLKRGDPFYELERIVVGAASKIQLKFTDGGIINLIAQTEYRVDSYVFKDPNQKSELLSTLIKGGFRAITGSIAKENPAKTQIRTPLATIGVRGTIFEAILANHRLSVGCEEGKVAVTNDKGEVEIGPMSNTLYAIVQEGGAPMPSKEMPSDLAAVSFDVEGGIPFGAQTAAPPATVPPSAGAAAAPVTAPAQPYAPSENINQAQASFANYSCEGAAGFNEGYPIDGQLFEETATAPYNEGCAYDEARATTSISPIIPIGAAVIAGIVIIACKNSHHHHDPHSSSYSGYSSSCKSSSSCSYYYCCPPSYFCH